MGAEGGASGGGEATGVPGSSGEHTCGKGRGTDTYVDVVCVVYTWYVLQSSTPNDLKKLLVRARAKFLLEFFLS